MAGLGKEDFDLETYSYAKELVNPKIIGERLKSIIRDKGLQQNVVAQVLHVSPTKVSYSVSGNHLPDLYFFRSFAQYFNVSVDYLVGLSGEKNIEPVEKILPFSFLAEYIGDLLRKDNGIDRVLHETPLTKSYVYNIFAARRNPPLVFLVYLALTYGISIDYMMGISSRKELIPLSKVN